MKKIKLATRGSKLALVQAGQVKDLIEDDGIECEIVIIKTKGDQDQKRPLQELGGDGLFIREIESALMRGEADIAVHSAKDLPYRLAKGMMIAGIPKAASCADCLISVKKTENMKQGRSRDSEKSREIRRIGTGSPRRIAEYSRMEPDAEFKNLRGNINTRLSKLDEGIYDAIIMAKAGIDRININMSKYRIREFSPEEMIPAGCQGIIAVECRKEDEELVDLLNKISDPETRQRFDIERKIFCQLKADCTSAIAVHAQIKNEKIVVRALLDDKRVCEGGTIAQQEAICESVLKQLSLGEKSMEVDK